jgi:hypothetical protein
LNGMVGANSSCSSLTTIVSASTRGRIMLIYLLTVVMTKPRQKDGVTKYHVTRRVSNTVLGP